MTSFWDEMNRVVARLPMTAETGILRQLVSELHTYEHEHGGHTLDTYLLSQRHFKFLFDVWRSKHPEDKI